MNDLISRRAAIKAIGDLPDCPNGFSGTYDKACIIGLLEELPSEERKKGKWLAVKNPNYCPFNLIPGRISTCSVCGYMQDLDKYNFRYCPWCGAYMMGWRSKEDG